MLSKETIVQMLKTDKRAVARALVVLHDRQTSDEQAQEGTRYLNGRGFRPCHAKMGSSMAKQFRSKGYLSDKQINYWRVPDASGAMRIGIYWGQLLEEAKYKAALKNASVAKSPIVASVAAEKNLPAVNIPLSQMTAQEIYDNSRDFGNDMERRMVLNEQLGDVLDSDDPAIIEPIANEIDEIDAFWKKVRGL